MRNSSRGGIAKRADAAVLQAMLAGQAAKAKAWGVTDFTKVCPKKLKKIIREGVPKALRRELWLELSGGGLLRESFPKSHFPKLTSR